MRLPGNHWVLAMRGLYFPSASASARTVTTRHSPLPAVSLDQTIVVVIVDDDPVQRDALEIIIDGTPGMVCARTYPDAETFLKDDELRGLDVVLLDIGLPGMPGYEAIVPIRARWPKADVLMLTVYADDDKVFQALQRGATGYLLKNTPPAQLLDAIREIHAGGAPMTPSIARKVVHLFRRPAASADPEEALTEREQEVLGKLVEGKTNKQIGEELFISANTVAYHVKGIYEKLHVHSRAEAVAKAMRRGKI